MSTSPEMNTAELEHLLLEEPTTADQLASMKATLEHLVKKVDKIAETDAQQVRASAEVIAERLSVLREVPAQVAQGVSTRSTKQLVEMASSRIDEECILIEKELEQLREWEVEARALKSMVREALEAVASVETRQGRIQPERVAPLKVEDTPESHRCSEQVQHTDALHLQESRHGAHGDNNRPVVYEQLNVGDFDNVEYHLHFDPIAAAQGRIGNRASRRNVAEHANLQPDETTEFKPRTAASSPSSSIRCQSQGESSHFDSAIGSIFAAMALPEEGVFSDAQGHKFEDFIVRFTMKYRNLGLRNDLLVQLFLSKLDGYPKAVAKALPKHLREGSFDDLVGALRSKFRQNDPASQMKAYMELKRLRKTGDVTWYCLELERLSSEAYPDASEQELSRTRAGELVSQLTDWPEYLQLFTTMEIAFKELAYDMVKTMAQRSERSREVAAAMRNVSETHDRRRQEGGRHRADHRTRSGPSSTETREPTPSAEEALTKRDRSRPTVRCYNCNKQGHLKKDCKVERKQVATGKEAKTDPQAGTARIFTASLRKWICGAVQAERECDLVGEQTTAEVHLLGMSRTALLDTGSQISIIPLQMLQKAWKTGFDLDADVEEIPLGQQKQVYDASGNRMSFKGTIRLTLQLNDRKQRIAVFVMSGGDGMMVLGTNALRQLGYDLIQQSPITSSRCTPTGAQKESPVKERDCKRRTFRERKPKTSLSVTVAKRVYLRSGETRTVPVRCKNITQKGIFWSEDNLIPDMVWEGGKEAVELPVTNTFAGAKIFRVGEKVGAFEPTQVVDAAPVKYSGDMSQMRQRRKVAYDRDKHVGLKRPKVGDRVHMKAPREKQPSTRPKLANPGDGPYRGIDTSELVKLPAGASSEPLRANTSRRKRGRPRKENGRSNTVQENVASWVTLGHSQNLRRKCDYGQSDKMTQVTLSTRKHPVARSKKVADLFQLANAASIAEQECWIDDPEYRFRERNISSRRPIFREQTQPPGETPRDRDLVVRMRSRAVVLRKGGSTDSSVVIRRARPGGVPAET